MLKSMVRQLYNMLYTEHCTTNSNCVNGLASVMHHKSVHKLPMLSPVETQMGVLARYMPLDGQLFDITWNQRLMFCTAPRYMVPTYSIMPTSSCPRAYTTVRFSEFTYCLVLHATIGNQGYGSSRVQVSSHFSHFSVRNMRHTNWHMVSL